MIRIVRQAQILAAVALLALGSALRAQDNTAQTSSTAAKTGKAHIIGVVVDSLHGRYLSGAEVVIEGANTTLHTDSLGSFRIDTLPPGNYQVGVFHDVLDTLGLILLTRPFHVGPDSVSVVELAVPSAATLINR